MGTKRYPTNDVLCDTHTVSAAEVSQKCAWAEETAVQSSSSTKCAFTATRVRQKFGQYEAMLLLARQISFVGTEGTVYVHRYIQGVLNSLHRDYTHVPAEHFSISGYEK